MKCMLKVLLDIPPCEELICMTSLPLLTDADILFTNLESSLFPGIPSSVEVHSGFANAQSLYVFRRTESGSSIAD